jgi:hypothetical protein
MADDAEFAAGLAADLDHVHRHGIPLDVESVTLPALADLAQLVGHKKDEGSEHCYRQVRALLLDAIGCIRTTEKRRRGLEALLDLTGEHMPRMHERRDSAAPFLGYKNGNSFRQTENTNHRLVETVILEKVQTALLDIAAEHKVAPKAPPSKSRLKPPPRKQPPRTGRSTSSAPRKQRAAKARSIAGADRILVLSEGFPLRVDRRKGLSRMIEEGHYDLADLQIRQLRFKTSAKGGQVTGRLLRCEPLLRDDAITVNTVLRSMRRRQLRPASVGELLALGAQYPDEQCAAPIVALGAQGTAKNGMIYIPYLLGSGSKRFLKLRWDSQQWPSGYLFLAIGR